MKLFRIASVVFLLGFGLVYPARDAFACSCAEPAADPVAARHSDLVFSGTVVDAAGPAFSQGRSGFGFDVDRVYRGEAFATQWVYTSAEESSCGFEFDSGHRYVVFAYLDKDERPSTDICTSTRELAPDQEPNLEARGTLVEGRSRSSPPDILWALLTVAAGFVAYAKGRKRASGQPQPANRVGA